MIPAQSWEEIAEDALDRLLEMLDWLRENAPEVDMTRMQREVDAMLRERREAREAVEVERWGSES